MNIILTGGTGTLGSQLLRELLLQPNIDQIILLIRDKKKETAISRLKKLTSSFSHERNSLNKIKALNSQDFFNAQVYLSKLDHNIFIHSAGFVNLSVDVSQKINIFNENYSFTKELFNHFAPFIQKFVFISTAFSIGDIGGIISNNYHTSQRNLFRNYYEESKFLSEKYLIDQSKKSDMRIQILRPSVLGGNIYKEHEYYISKFMVYYLLGKFFYNKSFNGQSIRIAANFKTGLNIIPVDYVAKVISKVFNQEIIELNIVHSKCTNLISGMTRIIEAVDFKKFSFIDTVSNNFKFKCSNSLEKVYYKSIGSHLNPYLVTKPYEFDTELLESIVPIPDYDLEDYLENTIKYAKNKRFRNERW